MIRSMMQTPHETRSLQYAEAARAGQLALWHEDGSAAPLSAERRASLQQQVGQALKMAEIHATLAIAAAINTRAAVHSPVVL